MSIESGTNIPEISSGLLACNVRQMAEGLGVNTAEVDHSRLISIITDIAYQRRSEQLGASSEIVQDPDQSAEFLFNLALKTPGDKTIVPGLSSTGRIIDGILRFLGQTEVERSKLSDFSFFNRANKNRKELRKQAGQLLRIGLSRKQLTEEFQTINNIFYEHVKFEDSRGLNREEQFLSEEMLNVVRRRLVQFYVAGAENFSMHLIAPDWYWPITWSDDPTFADAKEINTILEDWQRPDKQSTAWQAFVDYSKMFNGWLEGRKQLMTLRSPELTCLQPLYRDRFTKWGQTARGIKKG